MRPPTFRAMLAAVLLSIVSSYIVYFGFTTNYTIHAFSPSSFKKQYDHSVYKYRVLSKQLLLFADKSLGNLYPEQKAESRLLLMDKIASERFYYAYFYLNTLFLIFASITLVLLVWTEDKIKMNEGEKAFILFLVPILICLTQYVVCPYDISSYFFQLLTIFVFIKYYKSYYIFSISSICLLLIIATLNRESSALSVSLLLVLLACMFGFTKTTLISCALVILSFLATYISLRIYIIDPNEQVRNIDFFSYNLLLIQNNAGILFWGLLFYLTMAIANSPENKFIIVLYHLASLPYIWTCLKAGVLWETRLYIPLFLGSLILSKIDVSQFKFHPLAYWHSTRLSKKLNTIIHSL